jgi:hypothetical protein
MNNNCLEYDRIVEINYIKLIVTQDFKHNRRNLVCKSNKVNSFIINKNLDIKKLENNIMLSNLLQNNYFDDIEIIEVKGYY